MNHRIRGLRVTCVLPIAALAALALSACGSSSNDAATSLLKQTFSGPHTVKSGNLSFNLTVNPEGSTTVTAPITLSFGGPFQSLGAGKLPASNFNISVSALGKSGSLGILSTGTSGYVTLQGTSYQLPAATFQKLESSFAQIAASPGGGSGSGGTLAKLGISPLRWLTNPTVVGTESVGGADTTHLRAAVNIDALLADLGKLLQKASSLGVSGASRIPSSISAATRSKIASEVMNPTFDVWTGTSDKTIRKLAIGLTLPVTGQISGLLGGLRAAQIGVSLQYADLNQPQTIQAPATVRPFSEFSAKLQAFLGSIQGSVAGSLGSAGALLGSTGSSSSTRSTGPAGSAVPIGPTGASGAASTAARVQAYTRCIQTAAGDVAKLQSCQKLLSGK